MDCETFEKIVIERVFSELDELTSGAAQRHVAHCSRCRSIEAGLRATREVVILPLTDPPSDFAPSVLALERSARKRLPLRERFGRTVSIMAGYAMRPQLTMVALSLLMVGFSLFLLRSRPSGRELVQITERGVPEGESLPPAPTSSGSPQGVSVGRSSALALGAGAPSPLSAPTSATPGGGAAPGASADSQGGVRQTLQSILETTKTAGCEPFVAQLSALRDSEGQSPLGDEASFHLALCYASLGRSEAARVLFSELARRAGPFAGASRERLEAADN